jgi:manganese oxidase
VLTRDAGPAGAIIVTAHGKATEEGRPKDVDREIVAVFITINENESWYLDQNIRTYATDPAGVIKAERMSEEIGGPLGPMGV